MKRLCIFVLYSPDAVLEDYKEYLIKSLKKCCDRFVIVVNGRFLEKERLQALADDVICRGNEGFDAGAYKDVFTVYKDRIRPQDYDEILLTNDTVFGPFWSPEEIFERMESVSCDFWGLTRHPDYTAKDGRIIREHVQSWFLVLRRRLFLSEDFREFWENLPVFESVRGAVDGFEIAFSSAFTEKGYKSAVYTDETDGGFLREAAPANPCTTYNYELITRCGVPFLKAKCFILSTPGYEKVFDIIRWIQENTSYPALFLTKAIEAIDERQGTRVRIHYRKLDEFVGNHGRVFLFGTGDYGRRMKAYCDYRGFETAGFLTSNREDPSQKIFRLDNYQFLPDDGVILSLMRENALAVAPAVEDRVGRANMYLPEYR